MCIIRWLSSRNRRYFPTRVSVGGMAAASENGDGGSDAETRSPSVYLGGFLTLYAEEPDDVSLRLPREVVDRELGSAGALDLPLNVNHDDDAVVGSVYELFDLDAGLFCFGEIYSVSFLDIVKKAASRSALVARGPGDGLEPDPVVEYLSTGFPGLSLSSAALEDRGKGGGFFRHVSICGVGRRRGTLAVYGRDPAWILSRFQPILEREREAVSARVFVGIQRSSERALTSVDPFSSDPYGLLANSVDTAYIRERFFKLEYDKRILGLGRGTYIKASESPGEVQECSIKEAEDDDAVVRNDGVMSQGHGGAAGGAAPVSLSAVGAAQSSTLPSDCVYLSRDALVSILDAHRQGSVVNPSVGTQDFVGVSPHQLQMSRRYESYPHFPSYPMDARRFSGFGGQVPPTIPYDGRMPPVSRGERDLWYAPRHPETALYDPYYARFGYVNTGFRPYDAEEREDGGPRRVSDVDRTEGRRRNAPRSRRRRQFADDSDGDGDEVATFPGDVDYPNGRKRIKSAGSSSRDEDLSSDALGEVRAALDAIRKDLSRMKAAAHQVDGPPSSLPAASSSEDGGSSVRRPDKTTSPPSREGNDSPSAGTVGSSGQKWSDLAPAAERTTEKNDAVSRTQLAVNAACEPHAGQGGRGGVGGAMTKSDILEVNRRMFVSVLNKLDS